MQKALHCQTYVSVTAPLTAQKLPSTAPEVYYDTACQLVPERSRPIRMPDNAIASRRSQAVISPCFGRDRQCGASPRRGGKVSPCMSSPTGPPDGLRVTFLRLSFVTREETGYAILARHFSWGQEPWQESAIDPSRGWAPACQVSMKQYFFCMERRLWSNRKRSARDIEVLRAQRSRYPR
jgi:hypothetical protein